MTWTADNNRVRVLAIYAVAFTTPGVYRGAAAAAEAIGCNPTARLAVGYTMFAAGGIATWALATRSRWAPTIAGITPPHRSGLPSSLCDPLIVIVALGAIFATSLILGPFGMDAEILSDSVGIAYRVVLATGAVLIVPVSEEVAGRWLLYRGLRPTQANSLSPRDRLRATAPAALMSGAAFGLFHYMVAGPTRLVVTAIVGVILAVSYEWSGTLRVPIAVHVFINATGRLAAEFASAGRYVAIIFVLVVALPAFIALVRMRTSWRTTS